MKLKFDENLPVDLTDVYQQAGYDASSVFQQNLSGGKDEHLLSICRADADVRTYPPSENRGIVVLRLQRRDKLHVIEIMARLLGTFESEEVDRRLWIVDESRVRIRE